MRQHVRRLLNVVQRHLKIPFLIHSRAFDLSHKNIRADAEEKESEFRNMIWLGITLKTKEWIWITFRRDPRAACAKGDSCRVATSRKCYSERTARRLHYQHTKNKGRPELWDLAHVSQAKRLWLWCALPIQRKQREIHNWKLIIFWNWSRRHFKIYPHHVESLRTVN